MENLFLIFWTAVIFASIAWYAFLLFYVAFKGAREIRRMTKELGKRENYRSDQ
jgi:hypothetical protein